MDRDLSLFVAPEGRASFRAEDLDDFAAITPLTPEADKWLRSQVTADAAWQGATLLIDMRMFADLADEIIDAGYLFEGDAPT